MDFLDIKVLLEELVQCCQSPDISVSEWAERWYGTYVASVDKGIHNKTTKYGLPTY